MLDPRQQDHGLNKDELMTYRYSVVLVEVQSGIALQLAQHFHLCNVTIESMWYFQERF